MIKTWNNHKKEIKMKIKNLKKSQKNEMMPKAITGGNETETLKDTWLRQWVQQTYAIYKQKNIKKNTKKNFFLFLLSFIFSCYHQVWDFLRFFEIIWAFLSFFEIFWDFLRFFEICHFHLDFFLVIVSCFNHSLP